MSPREGNHFGAAAFISSHSIPSPGRCWAGSVCAQQRRELGWAQGAAINGAGLSQSLQALHMVARGKLQSLKQGASTQLHGQRAAAAPRHGAE